MKQQDGGIAYVGLRFRLRLKSMMGNGCVYFDTECIMYMSTDCMQNIVPKNVHEITRIYELQTASLTYSHPVVLSVIT